MLRSDAQIKRVLAVTLTGFLALAGCSNSAAKDASGSAASPQASQAVESTDMAGMQHGSAHKININNAILSELDKLEAKLGVLGLSNQIQASRPYATVEELVSKNVINQEQFDQIKDLVTTEDIELTGEAKDVDYMVKLGLMKGHLMVAKELLDLNQPKQAEPHIGHPVEEIYVDVEDQLNERGVKEFKTTLINFQDLVKSKPSDPEVAQTYKSSMSAVDEAIQALPETQRQDPKFVLQVINGLLDTANSEYTAAIADGKIAAAIEYQDSRGFVLYAQQLYKLIADPMSQNQPEAHKAIEANLTSLIKAWPAAIAPATPVVSAADLTKQVKAIETQSAKVTATP
ncbi:helix-hairpin-helix domain-containing protein [Leptolyngbya sp. FACHB-261]|uniref:helix-hairpin-helix domain-containing protein n=1 Tax=Leptolyngbya sp. FACHB-261 TaxID=2692806 RepID=UPI001682BE4D|nr:helix-hairpin-helix domain-containing protein [Leptolyngbya sp. FACHB-261]MBD2101531.1 helix-hairpin-helix domain-containing protein [Leptolyngbya sp. FACHB-261]